MYISTYKEATDCGIDIQDAVTPSTALEHLVYLNPMT